VLFQDELAILLRVSRATIERRRRLVIDHTLSSIRGRTQRGKSHAASDETPVTPQRPAARARRTLLKLRATHQSHGLSTQLGFVGLTPMKKEQVDLHNAVVWIPDSKTPNGIAEVPLTDLALEAFREQIRIAGPGTWLFPSDENPTGHQKTLKTVWHATLRRAKVPYFRIYDLRSTYATRLSAGGVADEWVTQLLRQGDAKVFKKYSQMKLQMKREALQKLNRKANEDRPGFVTEKVN
jgi:hypothetical protein